MQAEACCWFDYNYIPVWEDIKIKTVMAFSFQILKNDKLKKT